MPKGTLAELQAMAKADKDFAGKPEMLEFHKAENLPKWKKRKTLVGNGHCPVLTQVASGAPKVKFWRKGPLVKGNAAIPEGTVIACGSAAGPWTWNWRIPCRPCWRIRSTWAASWAIFYPTRGSTGCRVAR